MKKTMRDLVIEFIGTNNGVTTTEVQKYIVTKLQGREWDPKRRAGLWNCTLYGNGREPGIFPTKCVKVGKKWFLNDRMVDVLTGWFIGTGKTFYRSPSVTDLSQVPDTDRLPNGQETKPFVGTPSAEALEAVAALEAAKLRVKLLADRRVALETKQKQADRVLAEAADRVRKVLDI